MKKLLFALAVAACAAVGFTAAPAQAAGNLCGNVHVVVNGSDVINQGTCQVLP